MSTQDDNMKLWNQVCETDPATTKQVSQRGGFTAICAQAQRKKATEQWGPYGIKWGMKDLVWSYHDNEAILDAIFFFPDGEFQCRSSMVYKGGQDVFKKLLTDLTTKALSMLGFNSDVFEGKFDDNKYVENLKQQQAQSDPAKQKSQADQAALVAACKTLANKILTDKKITPVALMDEIILTDQTLAFFKTTRIENMNIDQLKKLHKELKATSEIPF